MILEWALIVQRMDTGHLWIMNVYDYHNLHICEKIALGYMKIFPYAEAACFLVYR